MTKRFVENEAIKKIMYDRMVTSEIQVYNF